MTRRRRTKNTDCNRKIIAGQRISNRKRRAREDVLIYDDLNALTNEGFIDGRKGKSEAGACKGLCIERDVVVIPVHTVNKSSTRQHARMHTEAPGRCKREVECS